MQTKINKKDTTLGGRLYIQIAKSLLQLIESDKLSGGDQLPPERELATVFEVSRQTIREALIALEVSGQVQIRPGSGVYVSASRHPLLDNKREKTDSPLACAEAISTLLPHVATLVVKRANNDELLQFEAIAKQLHIAHVKSDSASFESLEQKFIKLILECGRNDAIKHAFTYFQSILADTPISPSENLSDYQSRLIPLYDTAASALQQRDKSKAVDAVLNITQQHFSRSLLHRSSIEID